MGCQAKIRIHMQPSHTVERSLHALRFRYIGAAVRSERTTVIDIVLRFVIGGLVVTLFAMIGDLFKPKTFAGLFGAAPSVALATLTLTIFKNGKIYAAAEARSMVFGAAALFAYCCIVTWLVKRDRMRAFGATSAAMFGWFAVAFGFWYAFAR